MSIGQIEYGLTVIRIDVEVRYRAIVVGIRVGAERTIGVINAPVPMTGRDANVNPVCIVEYRVVGIVFCNDGDRVGKTGARTGGCRCNYEVIQVRFVFVTDGDVTVFGRIVSRKGR